MNPVPSLIDSPGEDLEHLEVYNGLVSLRSAPLSVVGRAGVILACVLRPVVALVEAGYCVRRAAVALFSAIAILTSPAAALEATEPALKAAFLYKFSFFVEWPQTAFATSDSPINLCIVGDDPFGTSLDGIVKGQKVGSRAIAVHRMNSISRNSGCHIVYLADGENSRFGEMLATLRGSNILTVTDENAEGNDVGMINFVMKDHRVRFVIDDAAAASGGLAISSRLLSLALEVKARH
jgi:hypothetical protein